jgi:hypothetical protein
MKAEHIVASYNGRDFTSKIATVYSLQSLGTPALLEPEGNRKVCFSQ